MSIKKQYLKTKPVATVTFRLAKEAAPNAETVTLVGDFNGWDTSATPMKKLKTGDFTVALKLDAEQSYQFRYLLDGETWENDWEADAYVASPVSLEENSVVTV